ncbi:MAG: J domain-containing protein [Nitrospirota bacterium]
MENYYQVLKVAPSASQDEIRKAYIAIVKKCHPDILGEGNSGSSERINLLNEAYHTLKNPQRRAEYDRILRILSEVAEPTTKIKKEGKGTDIIMDEAVNKLIEKVIVLDEKIKWTIESTGRFERLISGQKGLERYYIFIKSRIQGVKGSNALLESLTPQTLEPYFKKLCEERKTRLFRTFCLFLLLTDSISDVEKKVVSEYNLASHHSKTALIDIDSGKIFSPHSEGIKPPVSKVSLWM